MLPFPRLGPDSNCVPFAGTRFRRSGFAHLVLDALRPRRRKPRSGARRLKSTEPTSVIFLHIPRTGGTTLRGVLGETFGPRLCLNLPDFANETLTTERLCRFEYKRRQTPVVLTGHMNFGLHERTGGQYITFLRNPVERTISTYYFAISRGYKVVRDSEGNVVSLDEFIDPRRRGHGIVNMQTKMIAGLYDRTP